MIMFTPDIYIYIYKLVDQLGGVQFLLVGIQTTFEGTPQQWDGLYLDPGSTLRTLSRLSIARGDERALLACLSATGLQAWARPMLLAWIFRLELFGLKSRGVP